MIFSTRNLVRWTAGLAVSFAAAGCMDGPVSTVKTPGSLAHQPVADEATEFRAARQSVAYYRSGATQGYPTRWYYAPDPDNTTPENIALDTGMFMAQTFSLPVTLVVDYPFRQIVYAGDVLPPSYSAMPPLAPEVVDFPPNPDPDPLKTPLDPLLPPHAPIPDERAPMILPPATKKSVHTRPATVSPKPSSVPTTRPIN